MIVITAASIGKSENGRDDALLLSAAWLDGTTFEYVIDRRGIRVKGFPSKWKPRRFGVSIRRFTLATHDDVWTLLVVERLRLLRRTWGVVKQVCGNRLVRPLDDDEIGTSFGIMHPTEVAEFLRRIGYVVDEVNWNDLLKIPYPVTICA